VLYYLSLLPAYFTRHNLAFLFLLRIFFCFFIHFFPILSLYVSSAGYFMGDGLAVLFRCVDAVGATAPPKAHAVADIAGGPPAAPAAPLPAYSS
jgi:hypothetical protein